MFIETGCKEEDEEKVFVLLRNIKAFSFYQKKARKKRNDIIWIISQRTFNYKKIYWRKTKFQRRFQMFPEYFTHGK
jgi:hypothetical protein